MRDIRIYISFCLAGSICFLFAATSFPVTIPEITAALSQDPISPGETTLLTVSAVWTGEDDGFIFQKPSPPKCRGLKVVGTSQRGIAFRTDGDLHRVMEYIFTLKGEKEGEGSIGPVSLTYHRKDEDAEFSLSSKAMKIMVISGGESFSSILLYIGIGLAVVVVVAFYISLTIRRYKKKSNEVIADYVKNLEADSLKELDHARKYKIRGEIDKYLEKIWDILSYYLEKKYTITISQETWKEVLGGERSSALPEGSEMELSRILKTLEESRFGSSQSDNQELNELLKRVYSFIESQR